MEKYQNLSFGLKLAFLGKLLQTICEVLPFMLFWAAWLFLGAGRWFIIVVPACYFGKILFPIMCVTGLCIVGEEIGVYKKAAALCFVDIAALVIRFIVQADGIDDITYVIHCAIKGMSVNDLRMDGVDTWVAVITDIVHCVVIFLMVYFVCTSIASVLEELDAGRIAQFGIMAWKMQLVVGIFYMIVSFFCPGSSLADWSGLANFVAAFLYLRFLYKSFRVLGTQDKIREEGKKYEN
ncbi:MAG: hypothetical protein K2K21_10275 [Lachnospiraceae bacterium]|nr:hypothetical protein [Lachnospiraceae bacterium]